MVTYTETVTNTDRTPLAAVQARAAVQNAAGGIKGRRIEIVPCNVRFDLTAAQECARRAVAEKVVAFLHGTGGGVAAPPGSPVPFANDSAVIIPPLAEAGIPWLGLFLTAGGVEATNPVAFPAAAIPVAIAGVATAMVNEGCSRIAFLGGQFSREPFRRGLAAKGKEPVFEANFPRVDPPSVIPTLIARNVDCTLIGSTEPEMLSLIEATERAGQKMRFAWLDGLISERGLARLGPTIDGSISAGNIRSIIDVTDPAVRKYRSELDRFYPGISYSSSGFGFWGGADLLFNQWRNIQGDITAASTLAALRTMKGETAVFGTLDFTSELRDPQYRRMFMTTVFTYRMLNGKPVQTAEVDLRSLFDKAP